MFTKLLIWAAFRNSWLSSLYFVKPNGKMNAEKYIEVLEKQLKKSMMMTGYSIFIKRCTNCCGEPCIRF